MNDIAAILTAGAGALGADGGGIRFAWNKIESRFQAVEAELIHCREREAANVERRRHAINRDRIALARSAAP